MVVSDIRPILLLDCDGILADLSTLWFNTHNNSCQRCEDPLLVENVLEWDTSKFVSCGKGIYSYLHNPLLWRHVQPMPGAQSAVSRIIRYARIVVVTTITQGVECRKERINWLRKWFPMIDPLDIVITNNKACVKGEMLFDDAPHNLEVADVKERLMMEAPYNHGEKRFTRVPNWEVAEHVISSYFGG